MHINKADWWQHTGGLPATLLLYWILMHVHVSTYIASPSQTCILHWAAPFSHECSWAALNVSMGRAPCPICSLP